MCGETYQNFLLNSRLQVAMLGGQVDSHTGGEQGVVGPVGPTAPPKPSTATTKVLVLTCSLPWTNGSLSLDDKPQVTS